MVGDSTVCQIHRNRRHMMKGRIFQCAILFGVGAAIGSAIEPQSAIAGCFSSLPCDTNVCCRGSLRANSPNQVPRGATGLVKAPVGPSGVAALCGKLWKGSTASGGTCEDADAIETTKKCGGFAAVTCVQK